VRKALNRQIKHCVRNIIGAVLLLLFFNLNDQVGQAAEPVQWIEKMDYFGSPGECVPLSSSQSLETMATLKKSKWYNLGDTEILWDENVGRSFEYKAALSSSKEICNRFKKRNSNPTAWVLNENEDYKLACIPSRLDISEIKELLKQDDAQTKTATPWNFETTSEKGLLIYSQPISKYHQGYIWALVFDSKTNCQKQINPLLSMPQKKQEDAVRVLLKFPQLFVQQKENPFRNGHVCQEASYLQK
jgi:hypothetical protein